MHKTLLNFEFIYPLTVKKVDIFRHGGYRYEHITDLVVKGVGYKFNGYSVLDPLEDQYDFDIDEILYAGVNIYPVLKAMDAMDEINDACFNHIHRLFLGEESEYKVPGTPLPFPLAKIVTMSLKRKVN
jgi:hypothetical protein